MKALKLATLLAATLFAGCATNYPVGSVFTDVTLPVSATANNEKGVKTGSAECLSIMSLVAVGDCSMDAARKNGNITRVTHADWHARSILGIVGNYKLIVHGE
jgi:hypothetical protein